MMETPANLYEGLTNSNLSFWVSTPSFAELCAMSENFNEKMLPKLRRFLFCGETLTHKLVDLLKERFPKAMIYGHRDFARKACPCFDAAKEYAFIKP